MLNASSVFHSVLLAHLIQTEYQTQAPTVQVGYGTTSVVPGRLGGGWQCLHMPLCLDAFSI